ncbi:MAG: DUF58 domain-containing protein [Treponema sp.]|jgi:uncharacterized protein (DUF58 family)|nr:DUF58 domain-containing protein [Treponema sp.]
MDRHELLRRITTFPLAARDLAEDLLSGDFRSIFRGEGIEFDEVRHYEIGDDVRSIDWNVSARFGTPYVKLYREERELTVCIVLDESPSMRALCSGGTDDSASSSVLPNRYEQAVLAAALTAFSAERAGQRVGAVFFDRDISHVFSPRKGRSHIMAILGAALNPPVYALDGYTESRAGSNLGAALSGAGRLLKRRSLVVIISDFLSVNWERELGDLSRKHDVIAIRVGDPLDTDLLKGGLLTLRDPETGLSIRAPTTFASLRSAWVEWHEDRGRSWQAICRRAGAATLELSTAEGAPQALRRFFGRRRR